MFSVPETIFVRNIFKLSDRLWQAVGYESLETMSPRPCFSSLFWVCFGFWFFFFQVPLNLYMVEGNKWQSAQVGLCSLVLLGGHGCLLCPQSQLPLARRGWLEEAVCTYAWAALLLQRNPLCWIFQLLRYFHGICSLSLPGISLARLIFLKELSDSALLNLIHLVPLTGFQVFLWHFAIHLVGVA